MQVGMIGLGRMGANMVQRLGEGGHECVIYDRNPDAVRALGTSDAITGCDSLASLVEHLQTPRVAWLMLPAAVVDDALRELSPLLTTGDVVVDGSNSYYHDDLRRAAELQQQGLRYVDVGVSGGVMGRERGYCLMIGGPEEAVRHLDPIFATLAPGIAAAPRTPGRSVGAVTAEQGYLHCGPSGAGHFVKMVHNGIEYGLMAAYAEGFNILQHANVGNQEQQVDAETAPLRHPERYQYDLDLPGIAELWRRGSVVSSWLLDLTATALQRSPDLADFVGRVSDSGEGRWTVQAAIDVAAPAPTLATALFERFTSRGESSFSDRVLSAMRYEFGGHHEAMAPATVE